MLLYSLCLSLAVLLLRPRLVVYNVRLEDLRPRLAFLVGQLDPEARWAGDCVTLPKLRIQLSVEYQPWTRTVQLISAGNRQDPLGWKQLEKGLKRDMREVKSQPLPVGYAFLGLALALSVGAALWMAFERQTVLEGLSDMLRL